LRETTRKRMKREEPGWNVRGFDGEGVERKGKRGRGCARKKIGDKAISGAKKDDPKKSGRGKDSWGRLKEG